MKWTFDHYKHYSTEHMQKADKQRLAQELDKNQIAPREGILGKRREKRHNV